MDKVRIAVIGVGSMGSGHCRDLNKIEEAELVAICDTDKEKANNKGDIIKSCG